MSSIKNFLISIFLILIFQNNAKSAVILVHGSFATFSEWCTPKGDFYKELEKSAKLFNQKLISFSWSGKPTNIEIIKGAHSLSKVILSYPENEEIILIGHSHGGNVINFASQLLFDPIEDMMENQTPQEIEADVSALISHAYNQFCKEHVRNLNSPFVWFDPSIRFAHAKHSGRANHLNKTQDLTTTESKQEENYLILKALKSIKKLKIKRNQESKNNLIDKIYLLATPVDAQNFAPHMKIINHVYSFYSIADHIQSVAGLFKQTYPKHERLVNFLTTIENTGIFSPNNPTHTQMHNSMIAKWLLLIPETLKENCLGSFENFTYAKDAKIHFSKNNAPIYS